MRFTVLCSHNERSLVALLHAESVEALGAPLVKRDLTLAEREVLTAARRAALHSKDRKTWARGRALQRFTRADGDRAVSSRVADFLRCGG